MVKNIEVTISPEGEVVVEANGYSGAECERATVQLEKALGIASKRRFKKERFEMKRSRKQEAKSW